jgi:hypothetical protein
VITVHAASQLRCCWLPCLFPAIHNSSCQFLCTTFLSYNFTRLYKVSWPEHLIWERYNCFHACCLCSPAAALLLVSMRVLVVSSLQWSCPSTTMCIISLHMSTKCGLTIGSKMTEISLSPCSLVQPCHSHTVQFCDRVPC